MMTRNLGQRGGIILTALLVNLLVLGGGWSGVVSAEAQEISGADLGLEEIAFEPATLVRTFKLDLPPVPSPHTTVGVSQALKGRVLLDPRGPYLFATRAAGLTTDLDRGIVPEGLRQTFRETSGIELADNDAAIVIKPGRQWKIFPSLVGQGYYVLVEKGGVLHVYQEVSRLAQYVHQLSPDRFVLYAVFGEGFVFDAVPFLNEGFTDLSGAIEVSDSEGGQGATSVTFPVPGGSQVYPGRVPPTPMMQIFPDEFCSCHAGRSVPDKYEKMLKDYAKSKSESLADLSLVAGCMPLISFGLAKGHPTPTPNKPDPLYLESSVKAALELTEAAEMYGKIAQDPFVPEVIDLTLLAGEIDQFVQQVGAQEAEFQRWNEAINTRLAWDQAELDMFWMAIETGYGQFSNSIQERAPLETAFSLFLEALKTAGYGTPKLKQFVDAINATLLSGRYGTFSEYHKLLNNHQTLLQDLALVQGNTKTCYILLDFNREASTFGSDSRINVLLNYHDPGVAVYFDEFANLEQGRREQCLVGVVEAKNGLPSRAVLRVEDPSLLRGGENIVYTIGTGIDAEFAVRRIQMVQFLEEVRVPVVATSQEEADRFAAAVFAANRPAGASILPFAPDLTLYPEDLQLATSGAESYLSVTVHNFGAAVAAGVPVQLWGRSADSEEHLLAEQNLTSVPVMGSQELRFPQTVIERIDLLVVRVNPDQQVAELDYDNNELRIGSPSLGAVGGVALTPAELKVAPGQTFAVDILIPARDIPSFEVYLDFDPAYLQGESFAPVEGLGLLPLAGTATAPEYFDNAAGHLDLSGQIMSGSLAPGTPFVFLGTATFKAKSAPLASLPAQTILTFSTQAPRQTLLGGMDPAVSGAQIEILPAGTLRGQVALQGRTDYTGAAVYLDGQEAAVTDAYGDFEVQGLEEGDHLIEIRKVGFLSAGRGDVEVLAGEITTLPAVTLLAGDPVSDDVVDEQDLRYIADRYEEMDAYADLDGNGVVEPADLELAQANLGKRARSPWYGQVTGGPPPAGPVAFDFDLAPGNQGQTEAGGGRPGNRFELQLAVTDAPEINGWSAVVQFDPAKVRYVSGSFAASDFIPGMLALVDQKESYVGVGGTVLGTSARNSGDGVLGTLAFEVLEGFAENTQLILTNVTFRRIDKVEDRREVWTVATITGAPALVGDFDGDDRVDFDDFFLFADAFAGTDPQYDLDSSGRVDFDDFFLFADAFGKEAQAKLMALAHQYLGLPLASRLEANYPNPFNASTTLRYALARPGAVRLEIFDVAGQRLQVLIDQEQGVGRYEVFWDGRNESGAAVASGVYLVRLRTDDLVATRKMMMMK